MGKTGPGSFFSPPDGPPEFEVKAMLDGKVEALSGRRPPREAAGGPGRAVRILYAEDDQLVAAAVSETLELEGWQVETCSNGAAALGRVLSAAPFDALLFDDKLPGVRGVEIARRARELPCRRRTPILMLSGSECEREARAAGVDAYLRKPQDVKRLTATIRRLLAGASEG